MDATYYHENEYKIIDLKTLKIVGLFSSLKDNIDRKYFESLITHIYNQKDEKYNMSILKGIMDNNMIHCGHVTKLYVPRTFEIMRDIFTSNFISYMDCDSSLLLFYLHYIYYFVKITTVLPKTHKIYEKN